MDLQNLQTASLYVNNLLLSRGLLRNGTPIEFAKPMKAEGGANETMAKIINLVHDLVLRRDRETDTLSSLSENMQNLRSTAAQQSQVIARLESRGAEFQRLLALSVGQERTARSKLRNAETRNRTLQEDMGRLKSSVTQIRSQCANDVRKRDAEIKRLKRHLEGRRGREGNSGQVGVVVVTPGVPKGNGGSGIAPGALDTEDPTISLQEETNQFLTHLSRSLNKENEALNRLAKGTLTTLRRLQCLPESPNDNLEFEPHSSIAGANGESNVTVVLPSSYEKLALDTEEVLEHLTSLLTNPSFVPLEDLEAREDEIVRLRQGWEKMESRWIEAVAMMDGWRKRMLETGDTINLDDLRQGLTLGEEIMQSDIRHHEERSTHETTEESVATLSSPSCQIDKDEDGSLLSLDTRSQNPPSIKSRRGIDSTPSLRFLQPTSANPCRSPTPRKISPSQGIHSNPRNSIDSLDIADEVSLLGFSSSVPSKQKANIHLSQKYTDLNELPLTIQQKLKNARLEAEAVRHLEANKVDEKRQEPVRRTALPKVKPKASRQRSTLSPEELEGLMGLT